MSLLAQIGAAALLVGAGALGGWWATSAHYEAEAASARQVADDAREQAREQARAEGERIATDLRVQLLERARYTLHLLERQSHEPRPLVASCASVQPPALPAAALGAGPMPDPAAAEGEPQLVVVPVPVAELSLGAVSLWNSALAGRDVPAGACRLDDASGAACAARAGVSLDEAWANHAVNAQLCADDRARYERLIEFVRTTRPQR